MDYSTFSAVRKAGIMFHQVHNSQGALILLSFLNSAREAMIPIHFFAIVLIVMYVSCLANGKTKLCESHSLLNRLKHFFSQLEMSITVVFQEPFFFSKD